MCAHFPLPAQHNVAARSSIGCGQRQRAENQDNLLVIDGNGMASYLHGQLPQQQQLRDWPAGHVRLAVMDGMGGHGHGREAAEAVVAGLLTIPACTDLSTLNAHLEHLHARLQQRFASASASDGSARPGVTLTLLELPPARAPLLWHVGDSRLYRIGAAGVTPLTVDHVPATALAMAGQLSEPAWWQRVHGSHAPHISQAFILGNTFATPGQLDDALFDLHSARLPDWLSQLGDRRALSLDAGALYVLATDGFWSCRDPAEFIARWPRLCADKDAAACLAALFDELAAHPPVGLQADNLSAIVLRTGP